MLLLGNRKVVVVGGGHIATRKVEGLLAGGAQNITVVAPEVSQELESLEQQGLVSIIRRNFDNHDLDDAFFAITATDNNAVNKQVFDRGEELKIFVNSADDPKNCSSILMSTVRQGDVTIAISTAGKSPAFAKWCRKYLEGRIGPEYITLIDMVNRAREEVRARGISTEDINWDPIFEFAVVDLVREGELDKVHQAIEHTIAQSLQTNLLADATEK